MKRSLISILAYAAMLPSLSTTAHAETTLPREALATLREVAIQHNGRTKPLDSFARETLQTITGAPRVGREDPVATLFDMMANPERWQAEPLVFVPFVPLRDGLGMSRDAKRISYNDLVASRKLMRMLPPIVQKQQREEKLSMLENETMDAFQRFVAISGIFEQKLNLVPPPTSSSRVWSAITQIEGYAPQQQAAVRGAWSGLLAAARVGQPEPVTRAARQLANTLHRLNPAAYPSSWRLRLEVAYNHYAPFHLARACYLLTIIALCWTLGAAASSRLVRAGLGALWLGYALHGAGILTRVVIGGRPPVSNFFETTLWLPFVAVTLALILERVYRSRHIALAAAILAAVALVLADYLPLDSSVSPVVAVLRSNLWLTIHVLTIVASYGALGLATVLAHIYGVLYLQSRSEKRKPRETQLAQLDVFLYRVLQVGVVLLAAGIMLGAVWANASWGRYWGWDPKETWALITLLWFLAVLHGRFAGWLHGVGVALATIGGFFLLLMTYYGVSFYLVGLHSYAGGHATPIPPLLIVYLAAECAFLVVVGLAALARRPTG